MEWERRHPRTFEGHTHTRAAAAGRLFRFTLGGLTVQPGGRLSGAIHRERDPIQLQSCTNVCSVCTAMCTEGIEQRNLQPAPSYARYYVHNTVGSYVLTGNTATRAVQAVHQCHGFRQNYTCNGICNKALKEYLHLLL